MLCSEALGMSKIKSHSEGVNLIAKTNIIIIRIIHQNLPNNSPENYGIIISLNPPLFCMECYVRGYRKIYGRDNVEFTTTIIYNKVKLVISFP